MAIVGDIHQILKAGAQEFGPVAEPTGAALVHGLEQAGFPAKTAAVPSGESFGNMVDRLVHEVDGKMAVAQSDQQKVLTGESQNLHQAMLSMQEAGVSFSLMVEVRNKLVESYQELMRMQV